MGEQKKAAAAGLVLALALVAGLSVRASGCQDETDAGAVAKQVGARTELIGGPGALGEVGDYLLENEQIRVIIQGPGFSRGFGVFGGSLIDADLTRPIPEGNQLGGRGRDQFGELFPIFFLEAQVPDKVEVLNDGNNGEPAQVRVSGQGGDFLTLTKALNQAILNSHEIDDLTQLFTPDDLQGTPLIEFSTIYELAAGDRHVKIETTMTNTTAEPLAIPSNLGDTLLGLFLDGDIDLDIPLGHVLLFGGGNKVFAPGVGYNVRFALEDSYAAELPFPALPGLLSKGLMTTSSNGVSYGFFAAGDTPNFAAERKNEAGESLYEEAYPGVEVEDDSLLVPFVASAFTGVFYAQAPNEIAPGQSFTFTSYFVVGNGDVGSVMDEIQKVRGTSVSKVLGKVYDQISLSPVKDASVVVYKDGAPLTQFYTGASGTFTGNMEPGQYQARVEKEPVLGDLVDFTVTADGGFVDLILPAPGLVTVKVRDEAGRGIPAKVTVVGTIDREDAGKESREFLFDLEAGQHWRPSDLLTDDPDRPQTLQYIESHGYTEDGSVTLDVRAGNRQDGKAYTVFISRGMEYDVQKANVRVKPGERVTVATSLTRVVDTTGYIGADFHLHAAPSLDSSLPLHDRVVSAAAEGLELLVATDHNFITDYRPTIEQAGLTDFVSSMVGLELTTLEAGHFNSFPLKRDISQITRGSFEWSQRPPDEIFDRLRSMGKYGPENTIVQVNHARDSILGYFAQHGVSALTPEVPVIESGGLNIGAIASPNGPAFRQYKNDAGVACEKGSTPDCALKSSFSFNFDAMEIFNGKRLDQVRAFRMPQSITGLNIPEETLPELPEAGTILCDGEEVAFPGLVDDWFNLLNQGRRITGIGNSDSHDDSEEEAGYPRTYVFVGEDNPAFIDELAVVRALQNQRAIVTNGPFLELFVNDSPIGSDLDDLDGSVDVRIEIQAPAWLDVSRGNLIVNGVTVETFDVELDNGRATINTTATLGKDSWIVAEVEGFQSLFPIVTPLEVGPVSLTDAVGSLAGAFGFGASALGDLIPPATRTITPYAITNPIFVATDGNGTWDAPGLPNRACEGFGVAIVEGDGKAGAKYTPPVSNRKKALHKGWVPSIWFPRNRGNTHDVRVLFDQFNHHAH